MKSFKKSPFECTLIGLRFPLIVKRHAEQSWIGIARALIEALTPSYSTYNVCGNGDLTLPLPKRRVDIFTIFVTAKVKRDCRSADSKS